MVRVSVEIQRVSDLPLTGWPWRASRLGVAGQRRVETLLAETPEDRGETDIFVGRPALFTAAAVGIGLVLIRLPSVRRDEHSLAAAVLVGIALVGFSLCWRKAPWLTRLGVPIGYLVFVDLLRASVGGASSGFGGLLLIPVIWLAVAAGATELLIGLAAMVGAQVIPLLVVGAPDYPVSGWRGGIVLTVVAAITGFSLQRLLLQTRRRARENARLYADAGRWARRLESLAAVSNDLSGETDLQALLDMISGGLRQLLDASVVAVLLPVDAEAFRCAASAGRNSSLLVERHVPRAMTRSGFAFERNRGERGYCLSGDLGFVDGGGDQTPLQGLWVPLVVRDQPLGVIAAYGNSRSVDPGFSEDDLRFAEVFAARAAAALDLSERVESDALRRAVTAQEMERRRLARELHDDTGQALTSILMGLTALEERRDADDWSDRAAGLRELVVTTLQDVRRLALELRPKALDELGLAPALERLVMSVSERAGLKIELKTGLSRERLPSEIETALYRIAQEGLTNVVKHAKATKASVLLTPTDGAVLLVIEDDGDGFDLAWLDADPCLGGFGLDGMRERAMLLNGKLEIDSKHALGTTLIVTLPVP